MTDPNDFIWYAPKNHYYYVPTGDRWVKSGVEASMGKEGAELVRKNRMVSDERELEKLIGRNPYDWFTRRFGK